MEIDATQALDLSDIVDDDDTSTSGNIVRAHLRLLPQKDLSEKRFPLYDGDNIIGRGDECQIQIKSKVLSKEHACIEIHHQNHFIYDKDSRNKSRRGKIFMKPNARYELNDREKLVFGDVICIYEKIKTRRESESDTPALSDITSPEKAPSRGEVTTSSSNGRVVGQDDSVVAESDVSSEFDHQAPGVAQTPTGAATRVYIDETPNSELRHKDLDASDMYVPESQFVRNSTSQDESIVPVLKVGGNDDDSDRTTDDEVDPGQSAGFDADDPSSDRMPALMEPTLAEESLYDLPDPLVASEPRRPSPELRPTSPCSPTHTSTDSTQLLSLSPVKKVRNPYNEGQSSPTQMLTSVGPSATMPVDTVLTTPPGYKLSDSTQILTPSPQKVRRNPYGKLNTQDDNVLNSEVEENSPGFDPVLSEKRKPSRTAVASTPPSSSSYHLMPSIVSISPVEGSQSVIKLPPLEESDMAPDLPDSQIVQDSQKSPRLAVDAAPSPIIRRVDSKQSKPDQNSVARRSLQQSTVPTKNYETHEDEEDLVLKLSDSSTQKSSENGLSQENDQVDAKIEGSLESRDCETNEEKPSKDIVGGDATQKVKDTERDRGEVRQGEGEPTPVYQQPTQQDEDESSQKLAGAENSQMCVEATQAYGGATQAYVGETQAYGEATQRYGEDTQAYGEATQAYGGDTQAYGEATQAYGGDTQVYGEATQAYGGNTQACGVATQRYVGDTQVCGEATQAYGGTTQAYDDVTQVYGEATQKYGGATQAYTERSHDCLEATQRYRHYPPEEPTQNYTSPTRSSADDQSDEEATQGFQEDTMSEPDKKCEEPCHVDRTVGTVNLDPPQISQTTDVPDIVPLDTQCTQGPDLLDEDSNQSDDLLGAVNHETVHISGEPRLETSKNYPLGEEGATDPGHVDVESAEKDADEGSAEDEDEKIRVVIPKEEEEDSDETVSQEGEEVAREVAEVQYNEDQAVSKGFDDESEETDLDENKESEHEDVTDLSATGLKTVEEEQKDAPISDTVELEETVKERAPEKPEVEVTPDQETEAVADRDQDNEIHEADVKGPSAAKGRKRRARASKLPTTKTRTLDKSSDDVTDEVVDLDEEIVSERSCQVETSQLEDTQSHVEDTKSQDAEPDQESKSEVLQEPADKEPEVTGRRGRERRKPVELRKERKSGRRARGSVITVEHVEESADKIDEDDVPLRGRPRRTRGKRAAVKVEEVIEDEVSSRGRTAAMEPGEEVQKPLSRGRRTAVKNEEKSSGRGRKTTVDVEEENEEKPASRRRKVTVKVEEEHDHKPTSRGRRSAVKEDEVEATPAKRGRFSKLEAAPTVIRPRRGRQQKTDDVESAPVSQTPRQKRDTTPQTEPQPLDNTPRTRGRGRKRGVEAEPTPTPSRKRGAASNEDQPAVERGKKARLSEGVAEASPRRRSSFLQVKPKVLFTGVVDEKGNKTVEQLGGELVQSAELCSHLVTDKVRRTVKFLCCLGRGVPIVSYQWLEKCRQAKKFIDHEPFIISDTENETRYDFKLKDSIDKAKQCPLLAGWKIHVTKSVQPVRPDMAQIIKSAGGTAVPTFPKVSVDQLVIVSCDEDERSCRPAMEAGIPIVSSEFVLTGLLKQQLHLDKYKLFVEAAAQAQAEAQKAKNEEAAKPKRSRKRRKR